ncbi:peptide chain release factor N(5)-glutamine methyltransferase [Winogradskya consettensis]|uniref:peptide chain release factor N(5)-glutamine methyltransferase n=1 Tax=Winogradskya consettensis TaxID=113560 RepID=UPI001BB32A33|nr:peptide chain release factor N(5)-glutamine methyltransferase [Actinoplanes consettensis]
MTLAHEHPSEGTDRTRLSPALAAAAGRLAEAGVPSPRVDAELLAAHVLGVGRGRLVLIDTVRGDELLRYKELVELRAQRVPLQHVLGTAAFRHLELQVGDGVFVPRPETELLAGWGIEHTAAGATVVDLCSGSGAIALSVADEAEPALVIAVERSPEALVYLRDNARTFASVRVQPGDVTDPNLLSDLHGRVDVLLCNPPYVPDGTPVPPEVADHDPAMAVFGGADGLSVIRPVIKLAAALLRPGGVVGIEHDDVHGDDVPALLRADGRFTGVFGHNDLTDRPRFATASRL